jgi:predicted transcriptional regulator
MTTTTITSRIDSKLAKKVAAIAASRDRSRNWLVEDALKRYVEVEAAQIEGIKEALEWFETNDGIPHEQVVARHDKLLAPYGIPPYGSKSSKR